MFLAIDGITQSNTNADKYHQNTIYNQLVKWYNKKQINDDEL